MSKPKKCSLRADCVGFGLIKHRYFIDDDVFCVILFLNTLHNTYVEKEMCPKGTVRTAEDQNEQLTQQIRLDIKIRGQLEEI